MGPRIGILIAAFLASVVFGEGSTPIENLKLVGAANGNQAAFTNLLSVSVGSGTNVTTITSNRITAAEVYVGPNGGTNVYAALTNAGAQAEIAKTNYVGALAVAVTNIPHSSTTGILGAGELHVSVSETGLVHTAWQNPASATNWTWSSDGKEITLTSYNTNAGLNVVIPDMLDGLPVTGFGNIFGQRYEEGTAIISVSGGNNVSNLSGYAFNACRSLVSVSLPALITVDSGAFYECSALTSVKLGTKLQCLGFQAFRLCSSLQTLVLPDSLTYIGDNCFADCPFTVVDLPPHLTRMYDGMFFESGVRSVTVPNSVTYMEQQIFYGCVNLTNVVFGSGVDIMEDRLVEGATNLTSIYFLGNKPSIIDAMTFDGFAGTFYVVNPTATGWGATLNGRPVVRLNTYANESYVGPSAGTNLAVYASFTNLIALLAGIDLLYPYPVFQISIGGKWTDFEIKASTNNFTSLVYFYMSSATNAIADDPSPLTYFVDDYATDVRKWVSAIPHTPIANQITNALTEVETVVFMPSRSCQVSADTWMSRSNTNLVWSYARYGAIGYETNSTGTQSHWQPIRPQSWERARTLP
jgi:hypothetical protein